MQIAVDFDGTIMKPGGYPKIGEENPGAFHWMKAWQDAGADLILYTMRSDKPTRGPTLTEAREFCEKNGVEFLYINCNPEQDHWTDSPKVLADLYVDDAAFGCPLIKDAATGISMVDWSVVGPAVLKIIQGGKGDFLSKQKDSRTGDREYLAILEEMIELHKRKAADYGSDKDLFANVRASEEIGIPAWKGAYLRSKDKVKRIDAYCNKGTLANEGVEDSFMDNAAYNLIALRLFREAQRNAKQ